MSEGEHLFSMDVTSLRDDDPRLSGVAGVDADDGEVLPPLLPIPSLLESITPAQMAMSVHAHMKDLYSLSYDKEKNRFSGDLGQIMSLASSMMLVAFDYRRLSAAMAEAARENDLYDTFQAACEFNLQGKA